MKEVAIVGTQGVPAQYGGFETLVESLVTEKYSEEINYTVFCSVHSYPERINTYKGARLKYVPFFHSNGKQSIPYDILSLLQTIGKYDAVLVLGISGCAFMPVFRLFFRKKIIINIDGLEHQRGKWGKFARGFLKFSESMAVRFADTIVVDNEAIQEYVTRFYHKESTLITYGADHLGKDIPGQEQRILLDSYFLQPGNYALSICRIEPENNCHLILKAFADCGEKLVFIGNWHRSKYGWDLHRAYNSCPNIRLLDALYDFEPLYALRTNCKFYIHGHSAGGTNPSLVEAMLLGAPVLAFDCIYNKKTTEYKANYYTDEESLINAIHCDKEELAQNGVAMREIAKKRYVWKVIVKQYENLY
jgi:glycosyltransferase involved in cell wall biosynthesis